MLKRGFNKNNKPLSTRYISFLLNWRKAVSNVVSVVFIVMLTVSMVAIILVTINNFVREETESSKLCFDVSQSLAIESTQTCYNSTSKQLRLYLSVKNVDLDAALVSVSSQGNSSTFRINKNLGEINGVLYLNGSQNVKLPEKNSGLVYLVNMSVLGLGEPELVMVAPVVGNIQCDTSDSLQLIQSCGISTS